MLFVWYNPRCSKCQGADELLAAYGVSAQRVLYLDVPPPRTETIRVLGLLGATDPRAMMRTSELRYAELGLADASVGELIDAMAAHPELIGATHRDPRDPRGRATAGRAPVVARDGTGDGTGVGPTMRIPPWLDNVSLGLASSARDQSDATPLIARIEPGRPTSRRRRAEPSR